MKIFLPLLLLILFCAAPALALEMEEGADAPTRTFEDYIKDYVDIPENGTDWKLFGQTKEISVETKDKDGLDLQYYKPEFPQSLKDLDGKEIIIRGYMFPLDSTEDQKLFLFGPFPMNCPFQYHVGPSLVIEVHAAKPVKFSYDPVTIKGKLALVSDDAENSTFYRLKDARAD